MSADNQHFFSKKANTQQDLELAEFAFRFALKELGYSPIGALSETLQRQIAKEISANERAMCADDIAYRMYRENMTEVMVQYQTEKRSRKSRNNAFVSADNVTLFDFDSNL